MLPNKHIVLLPLEVPVGKFCWDYHTGGAICEHFDNEGGHAVCTLNTVGYWDLKRTKEGVLKAPECAKLIPL
jgi:hypothetical protein